MLSDAPPPPERAVAFDPACLGREGPFATELARVVAAFGDAFPFQPPPTEGELAEAAANLRAHKPAWLADSWRRPRTDPSCPADRRPYIRHTPPGGVACYPCLGVSRGEWKKTDWVIDRLVQDARLRGHKKYAPSVFRTWTESAEARRAAVGAAMRAVAAPSEFREPPPPVVTPAAVRDALYQYSTDARELSTFRPLRCAGLVRFLLAGDRTAAPLDPAPLAGMRWLDPCAGWLDRLFTARALGLDYLGFDPNPRLRAPADRLLAADLGAGGSQRVVSRPFEEAGEALAAEEPFDVVFTSPPYFDLETYVGEDEPGAELQSIARYPTFKRWTDGFLRPMLLMSWGALKVGGRMCINITDTSDSPSASAMHRIMRRVSDARHVGPVAFTGRDVKEKIAVVHCWEKTP